MQQQTPERLPRSLHEKRRRGLIRALRPLSHSITPVHTEVRTRDVTAGVGKEIGDGTHEVFWLTHLADRDQGGPVLVQLGVVSKNFFGPGFS